ncbi:hypothetical protein Pmani_011457 [Petrolisthes manimaculis]|uniref:Uncharacterized protein n=1 Tax=Petrolisthes manimaculis TaxID=1843537 RepID=A0AAE1UEE7_9EUCA|nr:hypothetical protein Pmani_011457 [Petrolisthes manimaculis]
MRVFTLQRKDHTEEPAHEIDPSRNIVINISLPQLHNNHQEDAINSDYEASDEFSEDSEIDTGEENAMNNPHMEEDESEPNQQDENEYLLKDINAGVQ